MNNFIQTLKNIWKIEELRKRILFTLIVLAVFRFGSYIVMPGVVAAQLQAAAGSRGANDLLNLINIYTGGAFNNASIFALGIMPYITASIIVQLLGFALPYFQRLQQHEGESGRKKLNQITRFLTVIITLLQGGTYLAYINASNAIDPTVPKSVFYFVNSILLATGTVTAMWLGERITDKGIGNGVSLLIMIGIIARLPQSLIFEVQSRFNSGGLFVLILEMAALMAVVLGAILLVQGVRKIPIQFAKRMVGRTGLPVSGNRDYLPIKLNSAGVMPIIFAQAIMFLPGFLAQSLIGNDAAGSGLVRSLNDYTSALYNIIYFFLVVGFTYVYVALIVNSQQYSEYLKRQNAFVPGVKPGSPTAEFIDTVTSKITLPGAFMLAILAITPGLARTFGINNSFAAFFGGSTILILVGVALDTLQQIESYLLMRKYDGLVKSGNIKGPAAEWHQLGPARNLYLSVAQGKIIIKSEEQIECIRISSRLACDAIAEAVQFIKPGFTGKELDKKVEEFISDKGGLPSFKGYGEPPFPASICLSINEAVVHGIPVDKPFNDGDVLSIDCGAYINGFHGDVAYTIILGEPRPGVMELCRATMFALELGVQNAAHGQRMGDIGFAIQQFIEKEKKFGVVRELVGHGVGQDLHEAPDVPNYGKRGNGVILKEGMVLAIEPMVNLGTRQIKTLPDRWTIVSKDGKASAHYEHTVVVRKNGGEILTDHTVIEKAIKNNKELSEISLKI